MALLTENIRQTNWPGLYLEFGALSEKVCRFLVRVSCCSRNEVVDFSLSYLFVPALAAGVSGFLSYTLF